MLQAVSCIAGRFFTNKLPGKPQLSIISPKFIPALESQREEEEDEYSSSEAQVPLVSWFGGPGWMGHVLVWGARVDGDVRAASRVASLL